MIFRAAGPPGVDAFQQIVQVIAGGRHRYPRQRRPVVGIFHRVRDFRQQQPGGPVDGAAAPGERLVREPAGGVDEHHALGPPLHHEPGEPGEVVGQFGAAQRGGGLGIEGRVIEHRVLDQQAPGPPGGGLPLRGPPAADVGDVEQPGGPAQLLDRSRGPEQRSAHIVVDVVEGIAAFAVVRPVLRRAVGKAQRVMVGQPVQDVDDGALVLGDGGIEAETVDRVGRRREGADQVREADLDPGPLEDGEDQAQVGQPPPVELPAAPGREDRTLRRVERVEPSQQPHLVRGRDQRVPEQLGEVPGDQVRPAQHRSERAGPGPRRGDQVVRQHQPDGVLIGAEIARRDPVGGPRLSHQPPPAVTRAGARPASALARFRGGGRAGAKCRAPSVRHCRPPKAPAAGSSRRSRPSRR